MIGCECIGEQLTSAQGAQTWGRIVQWAGQCPYHRVRPLMVSYRSLGFRLSKSTPQPLRSVSSWLTRRSLQGPSQAVLSIAA